MLQQLTKRLLESVLEGEMADHLGYDKHDALGRNGGNSRNGTRSKTVLTDVGSVEIDVPRDRDGSFEPKIVAKRQKRLTGSTPASAARSKPAATSPTSRPRSSASTSPSVASTRPTPANVAG